MRDCPKTRCSEGRVTRVPDFFGDFRTIGDSCNSSPRSFETVSYAWTLLQRDRRKSQARYPAFAALKIQVPSASRRPHQMQPYDTDNQSGNYLSNLILE